MHTHRTKGRCSDLRSQFRAHSHRQARWEGNKAQRIYRVPYHTMRFRTSSQGNDRSVHWHQFSFLSGRTGRERKAGKFLMSSASMENEKQAGFWWALHQISLLQLQLCMAVPLFSVSLTAGDQLRRQRTLGGRGRASYHIQY